jgi:hypothetical protein
VTHLLHGDQDVRHAAGVLEAQAAIIRECPKPTRPKKGVKRPPKGKRNVLTRKQVVVEIELIHHEIVHWRDGLQCVLRNVDGRHCGGGPQWGHVIPQGQSAFLKWNLSNVFDQCRDHNGIHTRDQSTYHDWYVQTFGANAFDKLTTAKLLNQNGHKFYMDDLTEILYDLRELFNRRFEFTNATMEDLVSAGFYGPIIKAAWIEDGRLEKELA